MLIVWAVVVFIALVVAIRNTDLPTEIVRDNRAYGTIIIVGIVIAIPLFVVVMFFILSQIGVI